MRILNSYEVSSMIDEIEQDVRNKYDLEDNWNVDCYPDEIHDLGIKIRVCNNEEEFEYLKTKVKELFERWAKDCVMEG